MRFYKACYKEDLKTNYIPGTVTTDIQEALKWYRIYSSKKKNKFDIYRNGQPVIIYFDFCENLLFSGKEFQRKGVKEHVRKNCWTSSLKTKAQINEPVKVFIMSENQLLNYYV